MDDEITGMYQVAKILDQLDQQARARVLRWAADKYGIDLGQLEAEGGAAGSPDQTMFLGVDAEKIAAAREARQAGSGATDSAFAGEAAAGANEAAATADEADKAAPERDPERPSFLDTSFRMYSGKQQLKKAKEEKK